MFVVHLLVVFFVFVGGCAGKRPRSSVGETTTTLSGPAPSDSKGLQALLSDQGLTGWIHGVVASRRMVVFTYRQPGSFFAAADFPLLPVDDDVATKLFGLKRHDRVRIKGEILGEGLGEGRMRRAGWMRPSVISGSHPLRP